MNTPRCNSLILMAMMLFASIAYAGNPACSYNQGACANYNDYANITVNSWTGNFPFNALATYSTGPQSYLLVNTSSNAILAGSAFSGLTISGYNQYGSFVGNVTAFPYPASNLILIYNQTQQGYPYNSMTIFFSQQAPLQTYLGAYANRNISTYAGTSGGSPVQIVDYVTSAHQFIYNFTVGTGVGGEASVYFNLVPAGKMNYELITPTNDFNMSLLVVPINFGSSSYNYTVNGITDTLTSSGLCLPLLCSNAVTAINYNGIVLYMNAQTSNYSLISRGTFMTGTQYNPYSLFGNALLTEQQNSWVNPQPVVAGYFQGAYTSQTYEYLLQFPIPNKFVVPSFASASKYFLIPAYTSNYIITYNGVTTPVVKSGTCPQVAANWFCFNQNEYVQVNNWNYSFQVSPMLNNALINGPSPYPYYANVNTINVGWMEFTTNFNGYSNPDCNNVHFEANVSGFDEGTIPYAVINCSSSMGTYLLQNMSLNTNPYNSFNFYYQPRAIFTPTANQLLLGQFQFIRKAPDFDDYIAEPADTRWIAQLSGPLSTNDILGFGNPVNFITWGLQGHLGGTTALIGQVPIHAPANVLNTPYPFYDLVTEATYYMQLQGGDGGGESNITGYGIYGVFAHGSIIKGNVQEVYNTNSLATPSGYGTGSAAVDLFVNFTQAGGTSVLFTQFYSTAYTPVNVKIWQLGGSLKNNNTVTGALNQSATTAGNQINSIQTTFMLGSLTLSVGDMIFLGIMGIFALAMLVQDYAVLIVLIALFEIGLFAALLKQFTLGAVAFIIVLFVVAYEFTHRKKA